MTTSTEMTDTQRSAFRAALLAKSAELCYGDNGRSALAIEAASDETDRIQQCQERDFAIALLDRDSTLLTEVHAALLRLDAGTFGVCLDCDEDVSVKRLAAAPWTSSCIACRTAADNLANRPWQPFHDLMADAA